MCACVYPMAPNDVPIGHFGEIRSEFLHTPKEYGWTAIYFANIGDNAKTTIPSSRHQPCQATQQSEPMKHKYTPSLDN